MILKSINPYDNQLIEEFNVFSDEEVNSCILHSEKAFESWRKTSFKYRKDLMLNVAQQLTENVESLARTITNEMGKTILEAQAEVEKCAWVCRYYANDTPILLHEEAVATGAYMAYVRYDPIGTVLGIMPWNYPFWQVFRFVTPTLMAGNVALLKHASNVQMCARAILNLFEKAGFPVGVFQNLVIDSGRVKKVIENDIIKAVTLTGSEMAGSKVAGLAGSLIKKSVLELGGSNAFIVLDDADVEKAATIGVTARMQNAGQSCIAAKRFILHKKISDQFINLFNQKINALNLGNPLDVSVDMGPLSSIQQADIVKNQVQQSIKSGAKIITGGFPDKAVYPPTLLLNVKPGMPAFDEEVFGPVASVIVCNDVDEAVRLSNQSRFGLGVSLFTDDLDKAEKLVPEFDDGSVFINALVKSDPRLPFGGTKHSGYGRELSVNGIREFVNVRTVYVDKFHDRKPEKNKNVVISVGNQS